MRKLSQWEYANQILINFYCYWCKVLLWQNFINYGGENIKKKLFLDQVYVFYDYTFLNLF